MKINPEFNKILREALDKLNKKEEQMKFTVIDESGNSTVVEAEDIEYQKFLKTEDPEKEDT